MNLRALLIISLWLLFSCSPSPQHKNQPVKISIAQDSVLNLTTLTIAPNGSLEIPGYWEKTFYYESRNQVSLEDTTGNSLIIGIFPPQHSIVYTDGMSASEWVYAGYEFENKGVTNAGYEPLEVVFEDVVNNYIISVPNDKQIINDYVLWGSKGEYCYLISIHSDTLSRSEQLDFLKSLFLKN